VVIWAISDANGENTQIVGCYYTTIKKIPKALFIGAVVLIKAPSSCAHSRWSVQVAGFRIHTLG